MLLKGPNPVYTYFWVVELADTQIIIPEFDLQTGQEQQWEDVKDQNISKIMWYPFNQDLANKITDKICVAGTGPTLELDIPSGCMPLVFREHDLSQYTYHHCITCGTKIYWLPEGHEEPEGIPGMVVVPQSQPLECPTCGNSNLWYCAKCKKIVDDPILNNSDPRLRSMFHLGEARCPVCEPDSPYGLSRIQNLIFTTGTSHSVKYVLGYTRINAKIKSMSYLRPTFVEGTRTDTLFTWDELGNEVLYGSNHH